MSAESLSSSLESSDNECREVIDMGHLRIGFMNEESNSAKMFALSNGVMYHELTNNSLGNVAANGMVTKRVEVCMDKKCKNSGGLAMLEEFKNAVGVQGAVVECKCLDKCKDGPNVRVSNSLGEKPALEVDDSVRIPANPLLIEIGLEDIDALVANYLVKKNGDLGLNAA